MANPTLDFPILQLTRAELDALPEYTCTLPTGQTIGKRWKRNLYSMSATYDVVLFGLRFRFPWWPSAWVIGEYVPYTGPLTGQIGIRWSLVELKATHASAA